MVLVCGEWLPSFEMKKGAMLLLPKMMFAENLGIVSPPSLMEGPWPVWLAARMPSGGLDQPQHPPHGGEDAMVSPGATTEAEPLTSLWGRELFTSQWLINN